uniref:Putative ovule protein n=1 Tax=Solanum chacoense TaxID=4108 RepID=A0A0V0H0U5_SOLCH
MLADGQNIQCSRMAITKTVKRPLTFSNRGFVISCLLKINPFVIKEVRIRAVIGLTCTHLPLNCYDYIDSNNFIFFTLFFYLFRILFD